MRGGTRGRKIGKEKREKGREGGREKKTVRLRGIRKEREGIGKVRVCVRERQRDIKRG